MITDQVAPQAPEPASSISRAQVAVIAAVGLLAAGIGLVLGLTVMQTRAAGLAPAADYVPANAVTYLEADLSLSPSQQDALVAMVERFPGDKETMLGDALAETLDDALAQEDAPFDYSSDIAPWFEGTVAVAVLDVPLDMQDPKPPATTALVGVTDPAAAIAFADTLRDSMAGEGATFTSSQSRGVTIWSIEPGTADTEVFGEDSFAYAVTQDQIVMGTSTATVEAALAVHAGGDSLAERDDLAELTSRLPDDRAGVVSIDIRAFVRAMRDQMGAEATELRDLLDEQLAMIPDLAVASLSFENDAIRVDGATSLPTGEVVPENTRRALAASVPNDAIFFADAPNVGASASTGLAKLREQLAAGETGDDLAQLEQIEAALGGRVDELFSWIGGGAVAAGWDGEQPYAGLVFEVTDADAAEQRLRQLQNLLNLVMMDPSAEVEITSDTVAGTEVTSVRFTTSTPSLGSDAGTTEAVIQYAMDGERLLIGVGDRFVGRVLQLAPGESLADEPRYADAIDRFGGDDNAGALFLDLAALRDTVESELGDMLPPGYATDTQPYLAPLDLVAGVTRVENGAVITRYGLVLR